MVFVKKVELHYENLSESTKLRFIELEINAAINTLADGIFKSDKSPKLTAIKHITECLVPDYDKQMLRDDLANAFNNFRFRKPTKDEIIHYFRYKRIGTAKIAKYAKTSPNRIQDMKDDHPNLTPVYPSWLGFTGLVQNWDILKKTINFFDDELIQNKDTHSLQLFEKEINEDDEIQITPLTVEEEFEPLEPLGMMIAYRELCDPAADPNYNMVKAFVAGHGHIDLDEPFHSDILNGKYNLVEMGVIDYVQDEEDREKLLKIYSKGVK